LPLASYINRDYVKKCRKIPTKEYTFWHRVRTLKAPFFQKNILFLFLTAKVSVSQCYIIMIHVFVSVYYFLLVNSWFDYYVLFLFYFNLLFCFVFSKFLKIFFFRVELVCDYYHVFCYIIFVYKNRYVHAEYIFSNSNVNSWIKC